MELGSGISGALCTEYSWSSSFKQSSSDSTVNWKEKSEESMNSMSCMNRQQCMSAIIYYYLYYLLLFHSAHDELFILAPWISRAIICIISIITIIYYYFTIIYYYFTIIYYYFKLLRGLPFKKVTPSRVWLLFTIIFEYFTKTWK